MKYNILIVDDEKEIRELLEINLRNQGYSVFKAECGEKALEILEQENISLMVLDIMMPGMSGIEVCKKVREKNNIPILMLSAKAEEMDIIKGIMTGADDYLCKPFKSLELTVRINALLRRAYYLNVTLNTSDNIIKIESMIIDKQKHQAMVEGQEIALTSREFEILYLLASNKGRVFSAEEIFQSVWKEKYYQSNNTVMVHMSRLRDKIEYYIPGNKIIHTVWGVGYKIEK
ncbi:MAG: response regulator transcription factor [Cellulosilyticaceae bacterium]